MSDGFGCRNPYIKGALDYKSARLHIGIDVPDIPECVLQVQVRSGIYNVHRQALILQSRSGHPPLRPSESSR